MKLFISILLITTVIPSSAFAINLAELDRCQLSFVNTLYSQNLTKMGDVNPWGKEFNINKMVEFIQNMKKNERETYVRSLFKLTDNDPIYAENITNLANTLSKKGVVNKSFLKSEFKDYRIRQITYRYKNNMISFEIEDIEEKLNLVNRFVESQGLSDEYAVMYADLFKFSKLSINDLKIAFFTQKADFPYTKAYFDSKPRFLLKENDNAYQLTKDYIEFLESLKATRLSKALKNFNEIYNYTPSKIALQSELVLPPHKQFLVQRQKIKNYQLKRYQEILNDYKLGEDKELVKNIDEMIARSDDSYSESYQNYIQRRSDNIELSAAHKNAALKMAKDQAKIKKNFMYSCNKGKSSRLAQTKKAFSRIKYIFGVGGAPYFYWSKNKDKMDSDQFWYEKLGIEFIMSILFTKFSIKVFANSQTGFWTKYATSQLYFGTVDMGITMTTYEPMFGRYELARYLTYGKHYMRNIMLGEDNPLDIPRTQVEQEAQKLLEDEDFWTAYNQLIKKIEEQEAKFNLKNIIGFYVNGQEVHKYKHMINLTPEDLESEEFRETLMDMIAEKIYYDNMGQWPLMQSGVKGIDRWLFYRAKNSFWDFKKIGVNLATFHIMCRQPFGPVGSTVAAFALLIADKYLSGDFTMALRRDAINQ